MNARRGNWMQTVSGRAFYVLDPRAEDVDIVDIAHALSAICRFGGHCTEFYSVAEHSVRVSVAIEDAGGSRADAFVGLLHDASEAYIGDIIWPLKQAPEMAGYKQIEHRVEHAISERFGLPSRQPPIVKQFDLVLLSTEKRDLMTHDRTNGAARETEAAVASGALGGWHIGDIEPLRGMIVPWSSARAKARFLARFRDLGGTS